MTLCFSSAHSAGLLTTPRARPRVQTRTSLHVRSARMALGRPHRDGRTATLLRAPEALVAIAVVAFALLRDVLRGDGAGAIARVQTRARAHAQRRARTDSLRLAAGELSALADEARNEQSRLAEARGDEFAKRLVEAVRGEAALNNADVDAAEQRGESYAELARMAVAAEEARRSFLGDLEAINEARAELARLEDGEGGGDAEGLAVRNEEECKKAVRAEAKAVKALKRVQEEVEESERELEVVSNEVKKWEEEAEEKQAQLQQLQARIRELERAMIEDYETPVAARRNSDVVDSAMQLRRLKKEVAAGRALAASIMCGARAAVENAVAKDSGAVDKMDAVSASLRDELQVAEKTMLDSQRKEEGRERRKRASAARAVADSSRQEEASKSGARRGKRASSASKDKSEKKTTTARKRKVSPPVEKTPDVPEQSESGVDELDTELDKVHTAVESLFEQISDAKDVPTNAVVSAVTAEASKNAATGKKVVLDRAEAVIRKDFLREAGHLKAEDLGFAPAAASSTENAAKTPAKRRGRPRKTSASTVPAETASDAAPVKRKRGRPRKTVATDKVASDAAPAPTDGKVKRGRGRPRKTRSPVDEQQVSE